VSDKKRDDVDPLAQTSHAAPTVEAQAPRLPVPPRASGVRWAILGIVLVAAMVAGIVMAMSADKKAAAAPKPRAARARDGAERRVDDRPGALVECGDYCGFDHWV
jgi:hypothetical protein